MTNKPPKMAEKGFTLAETLAVLTLISLLVTMAAPPLQGYIRTLEMRNTLRQINQLVRQGQILARQSYHPCRIIVREREVLVQQKQAKEWSDTEFVLESPRSIAIRQNQMPIFYPSGAIVPLCSFFVTSPGHEHRIAISAAGRVQISRLR